MPLARIGNSLVRTVSGAIAAACTCCVRFWCGVQRYNACGFPVYDCVRKNSSTPSSETTYPSSSCDNECPETPPCCCDTAAPTACGPCLVCVDCQCVPCPNGYTCEAGVCVPEPQQWYCCFDSDYTPGQQYPSTHCQQQPCPENRYASGPHQTDLECAEDCRKHRCNQDNCGGSDCEYTEAGEHPTRTHCLENCEGLPDDGSEPCVVIYDGTGDECPCSFTGGQGTHNYFFSIDPASRRYVGNSVCVSYVTKGGHPINVSLWAPLLENCEVIDPRVSWGSPGWRGCESRDCPDLRSPGAISGGPNGYIMWLNKQRGTTEFEVQVISPCPDSEWEISVVCGDCQPQAEVLCCDLCEHVEFSQANIANSNCLAVPYGQRTVRVPDDCDLPVCVHISGSVDDELLINGAIVRPGQFLYGPNCNGAHAVDHRFLLNSPSFTLAAGDNHGGVTGYSLDVCFEPPELCTCAGNTDCLPDAPNCCAGECIAAPCCPPNWPPANTTVLSTSGCTQDYATGISVPVPAGDYSVHVRVRYAAYNRQGPGCTSFKYRTSLTGDQIFEVNGCADNTSQTSLESGVTRCKPPADTTVSVEIFDYVRGWAGQNFQWNPPYSQCLAFDAPGWVVEVVVGACNCNPLP